MQQYKDFTVEVINEPTYTYGSTDNSFIYSKHYFGKGAEEYPISKHGVKILKNNEEISNCIVIASGGATGIYEHSWLIHNNQLVICCCNTVFALSIPSLDLLWMTEADQITCFRIFKFEEDYIVQGELTIARLDKSGKIKWQFGGADIFISSDGRDEFVMEEDGILLRDFSNTLYKIDYNGKLFWDTYR